MEVNFSVAQAALAAFGDAIDVKEEIHTASAGWKSVTSAASSMAPKHPAGKKPAAGSDH